MQTQPHQQAQTHAPHISDTNTQQINIHFTLQIKASLVVSASPPVPLVTKAPLSPPPPQSRAVSRWLPSALSPRLKQKVPWNLRLGSCNVFIAPCSLSEDSCLMWGYIFEKSFSIKQALRECRVLPVAPLWTEEGSAVCICLICRWSELGPHSGLFTWLAVVGPGRFSGAIGEWWAARFPAYCRRSN